VLDELDHVAADTAATTIENVFLGVGGEAIFAAALWTWTNEFVTDALEIIDAAPTDFVDNPHSTRSRRPAKKWPNAAH
jgi:hypothetical protein